MSTTRLHLRVGCQRSVNAGVLGLGRAETPKVSSTGHLMTGANVQDLLFVILTLAFFAVSALVVKGVERL